MTTRRKLAIAFGTLTALIALFGVILFTQMHAIRSDVQRQMDVSRPRAATVREMETHVVSFSLAVQSFLDTGDPVFREDAARNVTMVGTLLADYERMVAGENQREMAARFSESWRYYQQFAISLMDSPNGEPFLDDLNQMVAHRVALERILEDEMKPEAVAVFSAQLTETSVALNRAGILALVLVVAGVLLALATSVVASRAVLRSENNLREGEHRLRLVTDGAPALISYIDAECRYQNVNKLWAEWFARSEKTVEGRPVCEVLGKEAWEFVQPLMARAIAGETVMFERQLPYRDDGLRWLQTTYAPDHDSAGRVRGFVAHATDVTARKQAELALRDSETRLAMFIENAPTGFAIFDREMRYIAASRRWLEDHRVTGSLIGRSHYEVFPDLPERWKEVHRRGMTGEVIKEDADRFDRADGTTQWMKWEVRPWHAGTGEVGGIMIAADEITKRKQTEQALRESEARFRALFESAPVGIAQGDVATVKFISANQRYCEIVGHTRDELDTLNFKQFTHPDDLQADLDNMACLLAGEIRQYTMEKRYIRKDGSVVWGSLTVAALWEPGEKPVHYMAVVADINARKQAELALHQAHIKLEQRVAERTAELLTTNWKLSNEVNERKQAEVALRASEYRFRSIYEHANTGIAINELDGRFIQCNPAYATITGYTETELQAMDFPTLIHPEDKQANMALTRRLRNDDISSFSIENRYVHKNGSPVWVHKFVSLLRDEQGRSTHFIALVTNITERREAEVALRASGERLQFALETSHIGAWDLDLVTLEARRSLEHDRTFGYTELLPVWTYEMFLDHVLPEDRAAVDAKFQHAVASQGDWSFECRIRLRKAGDVRWIWAAGRHLRDNTGAAQRMTGIVQDITERKRLLDEIEAASERERERLGRDLHDGLSQLLVGARLKTDSLVKKLADQSPENVPRAEAIAALIARAVEESNNLARGLDPVEEVPEGLMSALTQLADATDRLFGKDCACEFPRPVLIPDHKVATELFRIAQEATNNAVKHGQADTIRIRLAEESGHFVLTVTNDGKPFPKKLATAGMGLKTMAFRADRIRATLHITPGPDGGTVVRCALANSPAQKTEDGSRSPFSVLRSSSTTQETP